MGNYDRFKFPSTLEALAAAERILQLGCPKDAMQQMREELVVDKRQVRQLHDLKEVIRYYHGETQTDIEHVMPSYNASFDFYFETADLAREVMGQIINITRCKDYNTLLLGADNVLKLDPGHFFHDIATKICNGSDFPSVRKGHKVDWQTVLRIIDQKGGMTLEQYAEWKKRSKEAEDQFDAIKRKTEDESRSINRNMDLGRVKLFTFRDQQDVTSAIESLVRIGVPGKAIQSEIKGLLLIKKNECEQIWEQVIATIEVTRGKRVRGTDVVEQWLYHLDQPKTEFLFQDDEGVQQITDRLLAEGAPEGTFSVEPGTRHLIVNNEHKDKLKRWGSELKSAKASLVTKLGNYRL